jgi:DNA-binding phage protein
MTNKTMSIESQKRPRDTSYIEALRLQLLDHNEAAAYLTEVIALQDQPALLLALKHIEKTHGITKTDPYAKMV